VSDESWKLADYFAVATALAAFFAAWGAVKTALIQQRESRLSRQRARPFVRLERPTDGYIGGRIEMTLRIYNADRRVLEVERVEVDESDTYRISLLDMQREDHQPTTVWRPKWEAVPPAAEKSFPIAFTQTGQEQWSSITVQVFFEANGSPDVEPGPHAATYAFELSIEPKIDPRNSPTAPVQSTP
jgi:hypothetical protein